MAGDRPRICVALVNDDIDVMRSVEPYADLFEVRIDLIGKTWPELARHIRKPWIATNRLAAEGGKWTGTEGGRIGDLLKSIELGASIIDIELAAPGLKEIMKETERRVERLVSFHDFKETAPFDRLKEIAGRQREAGADICKVVTTAKTIEDNLAVLRLVRETAGVRIVSFAMGAAGQISRVLSPLAGGHFTFASTGEGKESAPGQLTASVLRLLYSTLEKGLSI